MEKPFFVEALEKNDPELLGQMTSLLDFAGGDASRAERVRISAAVDETLAAMGRDLAKDGIRLVRTVPPKLSIRTRPVELKQVLLNLLLNAREAVLAKGLDSGTAFEILSIDIADVDVGQNIGAALQADQAEADKRRFQAEAEKRRAMAIAQAAENRAVVEENRAKVVLAEAEIPKAMAEAFRKGNLGIMDYYRMKNIQADTSMRDSIGKDEGSGDTKTS